MTKRTIEKPYWLRFENNPDIDEAAKMALMAYEAKLYPILKEFLPRSTVAEAELFGDLYNALSKAGDEAGLEMMTKERWEAISPRCIARNAREKLN